MAHSVQCLIVVPLVVALRGDGGGASLWWWWWLIVVVVLVVLDAGAWLWWWCWWLIVVRGTNNPLSRATPGGLGAPCGGETHSRTTFNPILPHPTRPIPLIQCYQVTFTGACYKLYGSFKTF